MRIRDAIAKTRDAFTLIEIVVAMAIIVTLAAVTALFLPDILRNDKVVQGANLVQSMLLVARQHAIRDQVPFGVRFYMQTDPVVTTRTICTEMAYVEQPSNWVVPGDTISSVSTTSGAGVVTVTSGDFSGGLAAAVTSGAAVVEEFPVQTGDYFSINPSGNVTWITGVSQTTTTPSSSPYNQLSVLNTSNLGATPVGSSYAIIRGPRRVPGEDSVKLPSDIVILSGDSTFITAPVPGCQNIPQRTVTPTVNSVANTASTFFEVVFGTNGSVVGADSASTPGNLIKIWVWDSSRDLYTDGLPLYVVVSQITGKLAVQPVNVAPGATAYDTYTVDQHPSGM
jgi:prepilin-type N-terminal cleavage/methylation domain-containing protein